jgi:hypothetical protein
MAASLSRPSGTNAHDFAARRRRIEWRATCTQVARGGTAMTRMIMGLCVGALALLGTELDAHHSMAEYATTECVTIQGEVVAFDFRNPHSFIHVVVTQADDTRSRYVVEWGASSQLASLGITATTLRPGDVVIVSGFPAQNAADRRIRLMGLERPSDGFVFAHRSGQVLG